MSNVSLQLFCNRIAEAGRITRDDVRSLSETYLADGLTHRDEADLLLALDRAVTDKDASFADLLIALVVDFAVWGERSTGAVNRDAAGWLAASIAGRSGPTPTGSRIAMDVVREAQWSDEALVAFALEANRWTRQPVAMRRQHFALAA
ncbi:hypothetical protein [Methylobacterium haplocladii]|uniref:Uncharacterized protein n=1 Tax=Methylobacterium haplocladii TaxID=1176176 RepID=A0A512IKX2_9HYPH|nr:hypothetical protein [Methylobacterium haplocladii]GEO98288.1 hypothetical protein MHA02_06760 [Methylobacterium haplocladii]GJD84317.1 hypothetical protein HPGCJGGD_2193 [Methylobacterium haplocladii]GLS58418.1 hypothetical protein GCM10007887_10780 [Methylobacterium haplocladii]